MRLRLLVVLLLVCAALAPLPSLASAATGNPLAGAPFYRDAGSPAARAAAAARVGGSALAPLLSKVASAATADWYGDWTPTATVSRAVAARLRVISAARARAVLVAYDIPQRDCGSYSSGGATGPAAYRAWIRAFAAGIGSHTAAVVLEPDALAGADCLSSSARATRFALLRYAVDTLTAHRGAAVYVDAGHAGWQSASTMVARLRAVDVGRARGFSLNVSNFDATTRETRYGDVIARVLGKHFVVDTGRNGRGAAPGAAWCNPDGRALGPRPTTRTGDWHADAFLWVKPPGQSDGSCNGGPPAGQFWPSYAAGLAQRAGW